jgi:hypothetical protein
MGCFEASVVFMVLTCVLSSLLRKLAKAKLTSEGNGSRWVYAEEAIATFELCAVCYELSTGQSSPISHQERNQRDPRICFSSVSQIRVTVLGWFFFFLSSCF